MTAWPRSHLIVACAACASLAIELAAGPLQAQSPSPSWVHSPAEPLYLPPGAWTEDGNGSAFIADGFDGNGRANGLGNGNGRPPRPGPNAPEPMVFDLIRPLGARQGEFEVNVLGLMPLRRTRTPTPVFSFLTGSDTVRRESIEWAPEVEYAVFDNFAIEFELPMSELTLEAYKFAAQYTFGAAFDEQFIHGVQGILLVDRSNWAVTPTLLYLAAARFDSVYTLQGMLGVSHEFGGDLRASPTYVIVNGALFAEVTDGLVLGVESNYLSDLAGVAGLLIMPQIHIDMGRYMTTQFGVGARAQEGSLIGEAGFRVIWDF